MIKSWTSSLIKTNAIQPELPDRVKQCASTHSKTILGKKWYEYIEASNADSVEAFAVVMALVNPELTVL